LGFSIVLVSITAGTVLIQLRRRVPFRIGEVESAIKSWVEAFGYGIRKLDIPDAYFAYQVTASDGNPVVVLRPTRLDRYLMLQRGVVLSDRHRQLFNELADKEAKRLVSEVRLRLAQANIQFSHGGSTFTKIVVQKRIPLTEDLTEYKFVEAIVEIMCAYVIANETITQRLEFSGNATQLLTAANKEHQGTHGDPADP
jgi:hypothetical protein